MAGLRSRTCPRPHGTACGPWHVEAAVRAALRDPAVAVRRLDDSLRGEPRFAVEAPPRRAVAYACAIPAHLDRYVLIEFTDG
ncbi:hypothetical protein HF998_00075 [Cellulomonas hominis]|uniref:Uncharacterized protein n=1 Tax=Cellulomonas hominis TaxID=156981 RepID=A0A7W8SH81_9CELL|nr:hypothetical protein [Cellulomonas hominis]MBB5474749.1 hypothetical protein [Cellulomonas hominis]NKY05405.1 hypothetical protein [Cellulomonas hominis]